MMRAIQALRPGVMLLVVCPLAAALAQPQPCDTLPAFQREFARAIGACRDIAPIVDVAPPAVEPAPSPAQATTSPLSPPAMDRVPERIEGRKSTSTATGAWAKSPAPSRTAASRKNEDKRRNEPLDDRGWKTYQDNRYAFRYPADLVTTSHGNGVVELHSADRQFRIRASSQINSQKDTVQAAWQQRLKEHGQNVTYKRMGDGWFVVSGVEDGKTYYRKHFVSPGRTAEFLITYPKSRASVYDGWVRPIEKSFVAHRVSDSARASSRTEAPSVVTSTPAVNETLEVPSVVGRSYADAANLLAEFKVQRVEVASAAATGEVLAQDPAPGSSLPPGSPIGVRVSDGSLASAAPTVPAPPAASVAPAPQLEPSKAPAQNDRRTGASVGDIASSVGAPVLGVLLGLLLGAVLMRRAHLARSRANDTAPAEQVDIAPSKIGSSRAAAEVNQVTPVKSPAETKFTARLDPGDTTIEFNDLPEDEEAAIEQSRD